MLRHQLQVCCDILLYRHAAPSITFLRANLSTFHKQKPTLPEVSSLHRTSELYTPAVEADPEFKLDELSVSIAQRGLEGSFPPALFDKLIKLEKEAARAVDEIKRVETERLLCHREFQAALKQENVEAQQNFQRKSKLIKKERAKWKELARTARCDFLEGVLSLPNKLLLRQTPQVKGYVFDKDTTSPGILPSSAIRFNQLSQLTLRKNCGEYSTGKLAILKQREMIALWRRLIDRFLGQKWENRPALHPCLLSDLVRLPAAEACAWEDTKQVIQLQHTKDDIVQSDPSCQPLINPHTRLCLVGSASLAAFTGSLLGCQLEKASSRPLRFLSLGNIYSRHHVSSGCQDSPSAYPFKQTRQISFLGVDVDEECSVATLDELADGIAAFWSQAQPQWTIRLSVVPVEKLRRCEMARWSILIESAPHASSSSEVELASVSLLGDWVSRRSGFKLASGVYPSLVFGNLANLDNILSAFRGTGVYLPLSV